MKSVLRNIVILIVCIFIFFVVLPWLNPETKEVTSEKLPLYEGKLEQPLGDAGQIALFGNVMTFPFTISELPEAFHIADMYYNEMTDGIEAGDYFHCNLLNTSDEEVAYIRVTNLKQNTASSPDGMTVTYLEAGSFTKNGKKYAVPLEIIGGIGIGSSYDEVKAIFPDCTIDENGDYSMTKLELGINTVTLEFSDHVVYKLSIQAY